MAKSTSLYWGRIQTIDSLKMFVLVVLKIDLSFQRSGPKKKSGQTAEATINGGLVRESPQNP